MRDSYILMGPKKLVEEARWRLALCNVRRLLHEGAGVDEEKWLGSATCSPAASRSPSWPPSPAGRARCAGLPLRSWTLSSTTERSGWAASSPGCYSGRAAPRGWGWGGRRRRPSIQVKFAWIYLNFPEFTWIYLKLPELTWIYMNLPKFTWYHLKSPKFTWIYLNLLKFTWIYINLPKSTWIHLNLP